jgi:nitrous oxidase accessory protein NosD
MSARLVVRVAIRVAILSVLHITVVRAGEGRIPVAAPVTIGVSGHYILTRNIAVGAQDGIVINAAQVTLDLNGYVVSSIQTDNKLIRLGPTADLVTIRGGRLSGGEFGIYAASTVGLTLRIQDLEIDGTAATGNALYLSGAAHLESLNSRLIDNGHGLFIEGLSGQFVTGRLEGNLVAGGSSCMVLLRARNMQIRNNVMRSCGNGLQIGVGTVAGSAYGGNLIEGNSITGCAPGITLLPNAPGNRVIDNVLQNDPIGLLVQSAANYVARNTIYGSTSTAPCGAGICVLEAPRNLIEANLIAGSAPGCGLRFSGAAAAGNSYRDNMLRDNAGGSVCLDSGAAATNDGGNIF